MAYSTRSTRNDPNNPLLFVYGTLRRESTHIQARRLAKRAKWLGYADFQGLLFNVGAYPGCIPSSKPTHLVRGDLYRLFNPKQTLPLLDRYERFGGDFKQPNEFVRVQKTVYLNGVPHPAWIYLYNDRTAQLPLLGYDYLSPPPD